MNQAAAIRPCASTLEHLDAISRQRPLTQSEARRLEWALKQRGERKGQKPWTRGDKLRLRRYLLNGKKPAQIAILMNRTERAVWRMMSKLNWTVRDATVWIIVTDERI